MEEKQPLIGINNSPQPTSVSARKERLVSLDAFRGFTIVVMIFVDYLGDWFQSINHAPWDGIFLADFVMPFFLFMVGLSMSMTFRTYKQGLLKKVVVRTIKLFVLGVATQCGAGFPSITFHGFNFDAMRIPGILQRIAFAYFCVAIIALYVPKFDHTKIGHYFVRQHFGIYYKFSLQLLIAFSFMFLYIVLIFSIWVPTYEYNSPNPIYNTTLIVVCDKRGDLGPECNAARRVDWFFLGWNNMYSQANHLNSFPELYRLPECQQYPPWSDCPKTSTSSNAWCFVPFDPEGILTSIPGVLTTYFGMFFGNVLIHYQAHSSRLKHWMVLSIILFIFGIIIHYSCWKMNKQMWTPSYLLFMVGCAGFCLSFFYVIMDFTEWQPFWLRTQRKLRNFTWKITDIFLPLSHMGMNTLLMYLFASAGLSDVVVEWFYYQNKTNNLLDLSYNHIFCFNSSSPVLPPNECYPSEITSVCNGGMFNGVHEKWAQLCFTMLRILFWLVVGSWLHAIKWYWVL